MFKPFLTTFDAVSDVSLLTGHSFLGSASHLVDFQASLAEFDLSGAAIGGSFIPASINTAAPLLTVASIDAVYKGAATQMIAEAAFSAMIGNGHVFEAAGQSGCACCGHDHGLQEKYAILDLAAQLDAAIASGIATLDLDSLIEVAANITGSSQEDIGSSLMTLTGVGGSYDLSNTPLSNEPAGDDLPGSTATTGSINVGGSVTGTIGVGGDTDWFAIDLEAGQEYTFIMLRGYFGATGEILQDPLVRLFDADGNEVAFNDDIDSDNDNRGDNANALLQFTPDAAGTYYVSAEASRSTQTGEYSLYVEEGSDRPDFTTQEAAYFLTDQFDDRTVWEQDVIVYDIRALSADAKILAVAAMEAWAEVTGLEFVEVSSGQTAVLRFNEQNGLNEDTGRRDEAQAFARTTDNDGDGFIDSVTVTVSQNWDTRDGEAYYDFNSYRYQTYIHEVGHAIGLGHGGPYNSFARYDLNRLYNQDAWNQTVMSYFDQGEAGSGTPRFALGLQLIDIFAAQQLYGVDTETRADNTVYGYNTTEAGSVWDFENRWDAIGTRPPSLSIYDAGGEDTIDLSGYATNQTISLIEGTFSNVADNVVTSDVTDDALVNSLSIAIGTVIENAIGGSGNDVLIGNSADNQLTGGAGDDRIEGGGGDDTAIFSGAQSDYTITLNADGSTTIVGEGTDTLIGVENAQFSDGTVQLETPFEFTNGNDVYDGTADDEVLNAQAGDDTVNGGGGNDTIIGNVGADTLNGGAGNDTLIGDVAFALTGLEGQVYRAYQAVFDRDPDEGGFNAFTTDIRLGNSTALDMFETFVGSAEFQATYGTLTNREFVELLYSNVLPGNNDQVGRDNFTAALDSGASTRAQIVQEFADSPEFINLSAVESAAFGNTIIVDPADGQVFRIYQAVFGRAPDDGGFTAFTSAVNVGALAILDIATEFIASAEFQATYGSLSNAEFVELLYTNVLPGNTDQIGRANFTAALDNGSLTREAVVVEFSESFEFRNATASAAESFVATYNGGIASDTLNGDAGNDILFGGDGVDVFVFDDAGIGADTVSDFQIGVDTIQLQSSAFANFDAVVAASAQVGADTVITFADGGTITLRNIALDSLSAGDFDFAGGTAGRTPSGPSDRNFASEGSGDLTATLDNELTVDDYNDFELVWTGRDYQGMAYLDLDNGFVYNENGVFTFAEIV